MGTQPFHPGAGRIFLCWRQSLDGLGGAYENSRPAGADRRKGAFLKTWLTRLAIVFVLLVAGVFVWRAAFPSPEKKIRKRLVELASAASFSSAESAPARMLKAHDFSNFFTRGVELDLETPGGSRRTFSGRAVVMQATVHARAALSPFHV